MKNKILIILLLLTVISCTTDERLIDSRTSRYAVLAITQIDDKINNFDKINIDEESAEENLFSKEINISTLTVFRNDIFLLSDNKPIIYILSNTSYQIIDSIDFSFFGEYPKKIIFSPGATSANVICKASASIYIVNLLTNDVVKKTEPIEKDTISDITYIGNYVYALYPEANKLIQIDTRFGTISNTINTNEYPYRLHSNNTATQLYVLSAGSGKFDNEEKSNTILTTYNLYDLKEVHSHKIQLIPKIKADEFVPRFFDVTKDNRIILADNEYLLIYSADANYRVRYNKVTAISDIRYSKEYDELLLLRDNSQIMKINQQTGTSELIITYDKQISRICLVKK